MVNDSCTLRCYGGARQLRALAQKVPAVAAAAARLREKGELDSITKYIIYTLVLVFLSLYMYMYIEFTKAWCMKH